MTLGRLSLKSACRLRSHGSGYTALRLTITITMSYPSQLLPLPDHEEGWPAYILECFETIKGVYDHAYQSVQQADDQLRVSIAAESLIEIRPLLVALLDEKDVDDGWIIEATKHIVLLEEDAVKTGDALVGR